ncbi:MAG: glucose-6-phosphate dehydrogenase [Candidatus Woesearchaeota archaeon]|jgi:glucose-6-phosphate 1-dehydrogenase
MKNYTIIIFGGTGDLAKRKLFPALKSLLNNNSDFRITVLGIGRKIFTDQEYVEYVLSNEKIPENMKIFYHVADVEKSESLKNIEHKLDLIESTDIDGRIYYLATSHNLFKNIVKNINSYTKKHEKGFTRIIAEKPFGTDFKSSKELNRDLKKYLSEDQIYRADHYLAKETIDNILKLRLSNPIFESIWNSKSISKIKMVVDEEIGVGSRLAYYDASGALKDMVQNHLLQTISFILMEPPKSLENVDFKKAKVDALKKLKFEHEIVIGQYRGYQEEVKDLNPGSKTETFVELKLRSLAKRWKGTEIILRTGKMLTKREAYIELEFKKEPCMLYCNLGSAPNKLTLHIQPLVNIDLGINTMLPGERVNLAPVKMTFSPTLEFNSNVPEGYEVMFKECLLGDKRIFICDKELEVSWKLTDEIVAYVKGIAPLEYEPGSLGPVITANKF